MTSTLQNESTGTEAGAEKQTFVMKCGGSTLAALPESFFADLRDLQSQGTQPVIVHGGGPAISGETEGNAQVPLWPVAPSA